MNRTRTLPDRQVYHVFPVQSAAWEDRKVGGFQDFSRTWSSKLTRVSYYRNETSSNRTVRGQNRRWVTSSSATSASQPTTASQQRLTDTLDSLMNSNFFISQQLYKFSKPYKICDWLGETKVEVSFLEVICSGLYFVNLVGAAADRVPPPGARAMT